ncbi:MAG: gluconate 2-dehydrogenase [Firmicutes bacterium]|nr:gluconate 2-dehydrogenase [Bacillota bacterium]
MKIAGIGDLLIPAKMIEHGFKNFVARGSTVKTVNWQQRSYEELQHINLQVETHGSEVYDVPDEIIAAVKDADIIITQFCPVSRKVIDVCKNLKIIGVLRSGYENINVDYATEKGILVYNTPGRNANAVADFTVGMLICECRNIAKSHMNMKNGHWVRDYTNAAFVPDLSEKTVGIIGLGQVGLKVAQRLYGFEMKILGYDPYIEEVPDYIKKVSLEEVARNADFLTIHTRLNKETEQMINADFLRMIKPGAYFINTARSGLVDEKALYEALLSKHMIGAALDVFDVEPPSKDYPLLTLPNVTVTPHLAGGTVDAFLNSPKLLSKEMIKYLDGKMSRFIVNKH